MLKVKLYDVAALQAAERVALELAEGRGALIVLVQPLLPQAVCDPGILRVVYLLRKCL